MMKCRDGKQCVPISHFCYKGHRASLQYRCKDHSDESVWGCNQIGYSCTEENKLWPCGVSDASECVHRSKVCDGATDKEESNNCPNGEDELPEMCR
jgi:hypothetical protein